MVLMHLPSTSPLFHQVRQFSTSGIVGSTELSNIVRIALEVWWFGNFGYLTKFDVEDGEICNMEAETQDGSGEIQKTPTT